MSSEKHRRNDDAIAKVAQNIRKYRHLRDLTLEELAFKIDADYSQVSRMERGKVNFSISVLVDIAKALDIDAKDLLSEV